MHSRFVLWFTAPFSHNTSVADLFHWLSKRLFCVDFLLILTFSLMLTAVAFGVISAPIDWLDLGYDWALPERFGYAKWTVCILCFGIAAWKQRDFALLTGAVVYAGILFDDARRIHERAGILIEDALKLEQDYGILAKSFSQMLAFATMGFLAALVLVLGFALGGKFGRAVLIRCLAPFGGLIILSVFVDAFHDAVTAMNPGTDWVPVDPFLTVLEDGGELFVGSLCVAFAVAIARLPGRAGQNPAPKT